MKNKLPTFPELLVEQGSFGKYQWIVYGVIVLAQNTNGWLLYGLSYLILYPKFDCTYPDGSSISRTSPDYKSMCNPSYFCVAENNVGYDVDWEDSTSLYNLTYKFNLNCASKFIISSLGMFFFSGFAVGSLFIPR